MTIFNFISLFGGLALFLYGMRTMGDGLKKGSSGALKKAMEKVTNNPLVGFLLGVAVTAVIQSSTATIVLTSGLVGAGVITLHQSLGIILGANVGTTVTGQIIRLLDLNTTGTSWLEVFKPSTLAPIAAIVGILLIMACHFRNSSTIGSIAMGFSILFTGLLNMTTAVSPLSESEMFARLIIRLSDQPLLGFLAGAGVAFSIQSSSATIGILQALSMTGRLSFSSVYSVIIGIYLGDCVTTAIVCSIGAHADAKRTGMVHILFNLCKMSISFLGVTIFHRAGLLDSLWSAPITSGGIANTHTVFNLACALLLLPFCGLLEKLSCRIIRDDAPRSRHSGTELEALDKAFFNSPELAFGGAHTVINAMAELACNNVAHAMDSLMVFDQTSVDIIQEDEAYIDMLADHVSDYLVKLSPYVGADNGSERLNYYIKCVAEFERIGDRAANLTECAQELRDKDGAFSEAARKGLLLMKDALTDIMAYARTTYSETDCATARHIEPVEEVIDDLIAMLRSDHIRRLREGICSVDASFIYEDVLMNMERIADQCSNIGMYTIALYDASVAEGQHDYIRRLHKGDDEEYNEEFKAVHAAYFARVHSTLDTESVPN